MFSSMLIFPLPLKIRMAALPARRHNATLVVRFDEDGIDDVDVDVGVATANDVDNVDESFFSFFLALFVALFSLLYFLLCSALFSAISKAFSKAFSFLVSFFSFFLTLARLFFS